MKEVEFNYLGVLNETEQLVVFTTIYNKKSYGVCIILNTALPEEIQDVQIRKTIKKLESMKTKDAKKAIEMS